MRYLVLATDYDGTLAREGVVETSTLRAIERYRASGGHPILVTGRELTDLERVFSPLDLFERIVAENGALLYDPLKRRERLLGPPPAPAFVSELRARNVDPLSIGRVIVATAEPYDALVHDLIRNLGLELQVIFNKGSVMVLPAGVNKATGLKAALDELELSPHNVAGIGDAENDHALLEMSELSVAVHNAIPALQERADHVTAGSCGAGVQELIGLILHEANDKVPAPARHRVALGESSDGPVAVEPYGENILIVGPSGAGKSTMTASLLEQLGERRYQFCLVDPEGDYESLPKAVTIGGPSAIPALDEVMDVLRRPDQNVVVALTGMPHTDRPGFFASLAPRLQELRSRTGRPHWTILDEAHHLLPDGWDRAEGIIPGGWRNIAMICLEPAGLSPFALGVVHLFIAVGSVSDSLVKVLGERQMQAVAGTLERGEAMMWSVGGAPQGRRFRVRVPEATQKRHRRKYVEGMLPADSQFVFRGPDGKMNLRAENLSEFIKLAEGVDEETWSHHLRRGDYSHWLRYIIKDDELADATADFERAQQLDRAAAVVQLRKMIEERYTA
jgi:hydroxymethylpyrimidine pyrophosphatase-like HAD family hydrolase